MLGIHNSVIFFYYILIFNIEYIFNTIQYYTYDCVIFIFCNYNMSLHMEIIKILFLKLFF